MVSNGDYIHTFCFNIASLYCELYGTLIIEYYRKCKIKLTCFYVHKSYEVSPYSI